jgi:glycine/D-amino acid oxidase-like deaminating enzyme
MRKRIGVIGAGRLGVATASFLQRDGHDVIPFEPHGLDYIQVTQEPTFACARACEIEST